LLPGDLVFFGVPTRIHHVGISMGGKLMVNAPAFGMPVQVLDFLPSATMPVPLDRVEP